MLNESGVQFLTAIPSLITTTTIGLTSIGGGGAVTNTVPFTWNNNDSIRGVIAYRPA
jgi:hypothetical protein